MYKYNDLCEILDGAVFVDQLSNDYLKEIFIDGFAKFLDCDQGMICLNIGQAIVGSVEHTKDFELEIRIESQINRKSVLIDSMQLVFKTKATKMSNPRLIIKSINMKYSLREELVETYEKLSRQIAGVLHICEQKVQTKETT